MKLPSLSPLKRRVAFDFALSWVCAFSIVVPLRMAGVKFWLTIWVIAIFGIYSRWSYHDGFTRHRLNP